MTQIANTFHVDCPSCHTSFPVDPAKVPDGGVLARCSACEGVFRVRKPDSEFGAASEAPSFEEPSGLEAATEGEATLAATHETEDAWSEPAEAAWQEPATDSWDEPTAETWSQPAEDESFSDQLEGSVEPEPFGETASGLSDDYSDIAAPAAEQTDTLETAGEFDDLADVPVMDAPSAFEDSTATTTDEFGGFDQPASFDDATEAFGELAVEEPTHFDEPVDETASFDEPAVAPTDESSFADVGIAEPEPASLESAPARPTFGKRSPEEKAQRLARVLVSDMITYNRERHAQALTQGTLVDDFEDEIKKSWAEYVDQVGEEVAEGTTFFTDALNEILADGEQVF